ncbi:MAG: hypothetical protein ACR2LG_08510 [Actinomycetota bacterium]
MAAKVETLRISTFSGWRQRGFVTKIAAAAKRWAQRGQLGSSTDEMRAYTGAR